jgi:hypothetical protein
MELNMKKIISAFLILLVAFGSPVFAAWDKAEPAGTRNASDIDYYIVLNNTALEAMADEIRGFKNLVVVRDSATQVTVTADIGFIQSSGTLAVQESTISEAIAITTSGASGLDTGAEASATWYYIWLIRKSSDGTFNGLLSASSSAPTMPSGYDQKSLVSAVRNNGSGDFVDFKQYGAWYTYSSGQAVYAGDPSGTQTVDLAAYVPAAISNRVFGTTSASASGSISVSNRSDVSNDTTVVASNRILNTAATSFSPGTYWEFTLLTTSTMYVGDPVYGGTVYVDGFVLNRLF